MATIVISILLIMLVFYVIRKMYRDRKSGKSSCGCGCAGCASAGICHQKPDHEKRKAETSDKGERKKCKKRKK